MQRRCQGLLIDIKDKLESSGGVSPDSVIEMTQSTVYPWEQMERLQVGLLGESPLRYDVIRIQWHSIASYQV